MSARLHGREGGRWLIDDDGDGRVDLFVPTEADGDRLYLHSDGLSEERNVEGEMFGMERIEQIFSEQRGASLAGSLETAVAQIVSWHGSELLSDDVAVLALELRDTTSR